MSIPEYTLTRKRMKTIRMTVKAPDGEVRVSAPMYVAQKHIDEFVSSRAQWIRAQQERVASLPAPLDAGPEAQLLRRQMQKDVPPLLAYWAERMGTEVPPFSLRRMTSRWGSCNTQTRRITLNLELGRRDPELLEYVIVHELAHLFERGHNARFYAVMDKHLPDWREKRRILNGS